MFKKYISKLFNRKKYLNIKSQQKIQDTVITFKKNYEEKILNIQKAIKEKSSLNFLHSGNLGDLIYSFAAVKELSKTHKCIFIYKLIKRSQ